MDIDKIKLISFDLWETLIFDLKNHNQRNQLRINNLRSLFVKYNQNISDKMIKESLSFVSKNCSQNHNSGFDRKTEKRIKEILSFLNIKIDNKSFELEVLDALDSSFIEYPPSLFPKTIKVLDSLKNNYSICLTSNTGITSPNYYRRYLNNVGILDAHKSNLVKLLSHHPKIKYTLPQLILFPDFLLSIVLSLFE